MHLRNISRHIVFMLILFVMFVKADVTVKDVTVKPRWPWNGLVDIVYTVNWTENDLNGDPFEVRVEFEGYDSICNKKVVMKSMRGDGVNTPLTRDKDKIGGLYKATWDAVKDYPAINSSAFQVKIHASIPMYMVVDLSGGPNASVYPVRYTSNGPNLDDDTCRTTELWLRRISAGKFLMGAPEKEEGRLEGNRELLHEVTISQKYYIGIFECTQRQWELVMGTKSSYFCNASYYATRPVEKISYDMIRGTSSTAGAGWPTYGHAVDSMSFMGKLQAKTRLTFDLPTDAQWEYACRAGTATALNSGKDLMPTLPYIDANMNEVGRYWGNGGSSGSGNANCSTDYGTAKVGSYLPNAWGLYDMHGNVWEWGLDWWNAMDANPKVDPDGGNTGTTRLLRGGGWAAIPKDSRSGRRGAGKPSDIYDSNGRPALGFRIACDF